MPIFKEITAAKKQLYLETLAATGRYATAVKAAGVDPSLPHYWRRRDPEFVAAEMVAKQQAAERILGRGRASQQKEG